MPRVVRQISRQQLQGSGEMSYGFVMGGYSRRVLAGQLAIRYRGRIIPALLEMSGELDGDFAGAIAVSSLFAFSDAAMQIDAFAGRYSIVQNFLIEPVNESISSCCCTVRPLGRPGRAQELSAPRQQLAPLFRLSRRDFQARRDGSGGGLHAHNTGCLQYALVHGIKLVDLPHDHLPGPLRRSE